MGNGKNEEAAEERGQGSSFFDMIRDRGNRIGTTRAIAMPCRCKYYYAGIGAERGSFEGRSVNQYRSHYSCGYLHQNPQLNAKHL
jgi:hypothetical protein